MALQEFKPIPDSYKPVFRKRMYITVPLMVVMVVVIAFLNAEAGKMPDPWFYIPYLFIMLLILSWGLTRARKKMQGFYSSYSLSITDKAIIREQADTPPIMIYFADISEIVKFRNGTIVVRGKNRFDTILIPAQMEKAEELESRLRDLLPFSEKSSSWLLRYGKLMSLPAIGLMIIVYTQHNKPLVLMAGSLLTLLIIWSFANIQRSKNVDRRTRLSSWWVLIPLAMVIYVVVTKMIEGN